MLFALRCRIFGKHNSAQRFGARMGKNLARLHPRCRTLTFYFAAFLCSNISHCAIFKCTLLHVRWRGAISCCFGLQMGGNLFIRCWKLQLLQPHLLLKKCISGMDLFCKQIKGAHVHLCSIPPYLIKFPDSHNWVREPEYPPLPMNCLAWPWPPIGRPFCHSPLLLPPSHKHQVSD